MFYVSVKAEVEISSITETPFAAFLAASWLPQSEAKGAVLSRSGYVA